VISKSAAFNLFHQYPPLQSRILVTTLVDAYHPNLALSVHLSVSLVIKVSSTLTSSVGDECSKLAVLDNISCTQHPFSGQLPSKSCIAVHEHSTRIAAMHYQYWMCCKCSWIVILGRGNHDWLCAKCSHDRCSSCRAGCAGPPNLTTGSITTSKRRADLSR
jgi:hypothetical protein